MSLFPAFERFATGQSFSGALSARVPRILGQGRTFATDVDLPPAPIERKMEYASFSLGANQDLPPDVSEEQEEVCRQLEIEKKSLASQESQRLLASRAVQRLSDGTLKNGMFCASGLVLLSNKKGLQWSWSFTKHYPMISKIPPDLDYLVQTHEIAKTLMNRLLIPPETFSKTLKLAWSMAHAVTQNNDILLLDVAKMFLVAGQDERFWNFPKKMYFKDLPEATFAVNLANWFRAAQHDDNREFDIVPAVLNQSTKAFFLPTDPEGTQTRPYIYIRKK